MKKLLSLLLSFVLLLSAGVIVTAGGEEPVDEYTAPTIKKPVHVTIVDELGNPVPGATVQALDASGNVAATYEAVDGTFTAFLEKGSYTLKITDAPDGYLSADETADITVTLEEAEELENIHAGTISSTDPAHKMFCKHDPSHLETYRVYDEGEEVTGYCFNQNYDPPALDKEDCTYKRLVGSPELLYELAQSKLPGVSAQELYDHVLSMIYHRDDIKAKYGFDDLLTDYLVNMAIKNFTDGDMDSFRTTDEEGKNLVVRQYYPNGPVVFDENGNYQFRPGGSVLGSIVGHANAASSGNPDYVFPQSIKDAWHELITLTDHPDDYYLYIYYPDNFMTKEDGIAGGWSVPAHYRNLYYADAYQCLMSTFEVEPLRTTLTLRQATQIKITKKWADGDNRDGLRPTAEEFTGMIHLLAGGTDVTDTYRNNRTVTDNEDGTYTVTFAELPKRDDNKTEIAYTVKEDAISGYTADKNTAADGETITNTHRPETTTIQVQKTWEDGDDADGLRPDAVTVHLLADGQELQTVTLTAENDWSHTFADLPVYREGEKIVYTVTEEPVEGYKATIDGFAITNTYLLERVEIPVVKTWRDDDNRNSTRPASITIHLLADGQVIQTVKITPDADGNWIHTFRDLPKYKDETPIVYTITEDPVEGYTASIDGFGITNSYTTPPTGDTFPAGVWMALLAASLLTASVLLYRKSRRSHDR